MMSLRPRFRGNVPTLALSLFFVGALSVNACMLLADHDSGSPRPKSAAGTTDQPNQDAAPELDEGASDAPNTDIPKARYVFLFIGDGMAAAQVHAAEAYLANAAVHDDVGGSTKAVPLAMTTLPVRGVQQTSAWNSLITDSAPAGTALATGHKTADGVISMDPTKTVELTTIAEVAKQSGMRVGIVSSASLDHATPAVFYAHQQSRGNYYAIALQLAASGFDYFGGGGFLDPDGASSGVPEPVNVIQAAQDAGYVVADTRDEFEGLLPGTQSLAIGPRIDGKRSLRYAIDRVESGNESDDITLAEFTQKGIELLQGEDGGGFFMMVEGGKIDWACHANDARAAIDEVRGLDEAVAVAIEFMAQHPQETLIVVTGDHETGGMSLGGTATGYASQFEYLQSQKISFYEFDYRVKQVKDAGAPPQHLTDTSLDEDLLEFFGLDYATLTAFEREKLDNAYAKFMFGTSPHDPDEDSLLYGSNNPVSVTITHIIDSRAGIGWTSFYHTAAPMPVMAGGADANLFAGYYENTEVAKKLAAAMHVTLPN